MIGDALAAACDDEAVLARLGGPLGEAARAKAAELRRLPPAARKHARAQAAAIARTPLSAGLRGIHPTWIEAALAALPARARADLAAGGADQTERAFDPAGVWLARWAAAALAPLPAIDGALARPRSIHDVARMAGDAIADWLAAVGADQLGFALGDAARRIADERVARALPRIATPPRAGHLGARKAAIARCAVELADDGLVRIGARTIAPHLDAFVRRQLALRLPRTRGLAVLFEAGAWAAAPIEASPTWDAIAAP